MSAFGRSASSFSTASRSAKMRAPRLAVENTASVMHQQEELVHGIVKRMSLGMDLSTDAHNECVAEGRLGLLEAHREFDRKHRSGAKFMTFAFPHVQRKVQEAVEVLGGVPRGVYRAAKKNAATARKRAHNAHEVHTEQYAADRVEEGADELHMDPFTAIGDRLEKNAVRAAIERLPDAQQREVLRLIYVDGLSRMDVCRIIKRIGPASSAFTKRGLRRYRNCCFSEALSKRNTSNIALLISPNQIGARSCWHSTGIDLTTGVPD